MEAVLQHLPLRDADVFADDKEVPFWQDLLRHPLPDEFWQPHNLASNVGQVRTPLFIRTGWFDLFVGDILETFSALKSKGGSEETRKFSRILVGPWPHNINQQVVGEEDFGDAAVIADLYEQEIAYIERFTKSSGEKEEPVAPIRLFVMGKNQWRDEHEWPLARTVWTDYFLAGDGVLGNAPSGTPDAFDYDPADHVPPQGGAWNFAGVEPCDQTEIEARDDVLVYSSEVLAEALEVTGPVEVKLFASSSAPDTDFTAKLVDVCPDGRAMSVTDGIVRARYRNARCREELLTPGEVYKFTIRCNPTAHLFQQGHRLRVEISSSNFPAFARSLNAAGNIADETVMQITHQSIYHSPEYPSRIILPVV